MNYIDTSHDLHIHNSRLYQIVSRENLALAHAFYEKRKTAKTREEFAQFVALSRKHSIVTIVFSAMALEAYISTYALRKKSRSHFKKNFRYLNLYKKWVRIPKKVTGASISSDNLKRVDALNKLRDKLVHSEPVILPQNNEEEFVEVYNRLVDDMLKGAEKAVETVILLVRNLVAIDPNEQNHVRVDNQEIAS